MKRFFNFIPNLISLLNLLSGCLSIIFALEGYPGYAGIFILIAGLFDFLDGFSARLLKAYSETGKELDSLADVVSFGVAPGMIAFVMMKKGLPGVNLPLHLISASVWQWILLLSPLLIPAFSALRLAKFNIDTRQSVNFIGMPTPANAILWASFGIISGFASHPEISLLLFTPANILPVIIITSLLMVSEIPMFSLKFSGFSFAENWYRYIFLLSALLLLLFLKLYGLPVVILFYVILSLAFYLLRVEL
ncbi:MAG: CDP-diacylglycerol--serine O-phosphatidyltransferase [Prolixibacteraceae bacterium]|mgnify:FL=1|jgi:CDP-diacylglycerol--serine O-phosphatidyltransferase|nr:CDP-diacylglycerol--serine O-phosphatidyltransferase [Prolixibacteraceae bacterium]MDI9564660.1 CDP-diacylglycerol--serine O-phosphatidyltransferase [Bacteroidota bacterium]OQB81929.1 MAG: CDP-alcohol phosphatidyltransferase [Bacteroidetes bacterium ADurb.Bin123]HNU76876.1 CDP-diacylglycerol--serine O-phosphatidyltransferase [Prolixibacteraceae bacterium]HNZ69651.1 CDP-diacylglycerol--serine O-phosphatidyltransferase [Prolixibacteraceae bacterium]